MGETMTRIHKHSNIAHLKQTNSKQISNRLQV